MKKVRDFNIPRCYANNFSQSRKTLHIFSDASEVAMATVAYWRIETEEGILIVFVAGKANCAPTKFVSIPRLELQAAVMAVRLKNAIVKHHRVGYVFGLTLVRWLNG